MRTMIFMLAALPAAAQSSGPVTIGNQSVTNSTTDETYTTVLPSVTDQVNNFLTRITASLNGGPNLFDQTFNAAVGDPAVQAAITAAENLLTTGGAASITGPTLVSDSTTLQSSTTVTNNTTIGSNVTISTTTTFGPNVIFYGVEQSQSFIVGAGDVEFNTNTDTATFIDQQSTTTNTYLTSQTYALTGSTQAITPEPATWWLAGVGLAGLIAIRRRAGARSPI